MNKGILITTLVSALLFWIVAGAHVAYLAHANPWGLLYFKPYYCRISIQSPQNRTYNAEPIYLNFTVITNLSLDDYSYFYVFEGQDWQEGVKVEEIQVIGQSVISDEIMPDINATYFSYTEYTFWGQAVLTTSSYGRHSLTVYAMNSPGGMVVALETIPFNIASEQEPQVSEPFPNTLVAASVISVAIIAVGAGLLLLYTKQHREAART